jgi:transketolase
MPDKNMRDIYCEALMEAAGENKEIVVLDADLMGANGLTPFKNAFPDRFINVGVAEANMIGIASGLSAMGKIPFASTFACFASRRVYDQFFISSNYARLKVNLTGSDPGITVKYNGGTHMTFEDIGIMRNTPDLVIYEPADIVSLKELVKQAVTLPNSTYMRLHRKDTNRIYAESESFEFGKGKVLKDGKDVTIIAVGFIMVPEAQEAAGILEKEGIDAAVIDMVTIKPFDKEMVLKYVQKTGALVVCENHQSDTGLGGAISFYLSEQYPTPMRTVGIRGDFGEVGDLAYLKERFGLNAETIAEKTRDILKLKR